MLLLIATLLTQAPCTGTDEEIRKCEHQAWLARINATELTEPVPEPEVTSRPAKCKGNFAKPRVGMRWSHLRDCAGVEFWKKAEDEAGTVYECDAGFVRVERGKVTRWIAK